MKGHVRRMDMDTWVNILKNAGGGGGGHDKLFWGKFSKIRFLAP